ncbi:hypothetical protein IE81DRAFT_233901 [Ceraceosorus guamensis]|uniref:HAM1-like N-terminal domain-containing protein n=1 Tax=Ceraceosorus guamensis TaxID=1522189 RepID=A0A316VXV5_9BASI|nr:hypothetical protein IE81DRAFT_233901 [Ceraceosorus guamensis]PWN40305.1 hypothetical protein IE81DRAFT_233901 [Ceraceosorus guamensis]
MHGQMPKQSSEQQDTWEDVFVRSLERMLRAAKESAEARRSVRTLLELFETWSKRLSSVQERVDRAASVSLQAADNPKEALQDAREEAGTAVQAELHNSQLDAELDISNEMWSRLNALGLAARQTLEGLAGGKSLHPIVDASTRAITALRKETETRQWLKELGDVVREAMGSPDASDDHDDEDDADDDSEARGTRTGDAALTEKLRALLRDFVELINKRPELSAALDELKAQLLDFADAIRSEPGLASLGRRFARMGKALQTLFESFGQSSALSPQGIIDAIRDAPVTRAVKAVVKRLLPTWQQVLKSVPLPRVEFTSDQADASVDDIRIPALNLIPEHVGLSLRTDYTYDRDRRSHDVTTNTDTNVRLSLAGFRLGIEDVSFWVEEKGESI